MFERASDSEVESVFGRNGGHYNIFRLKDPAYGVAMLRRWFADGEADDLNFVLFSTSGIHGMYTTIEEIEEELRQQVGQEPPEITFLIVQPRIVKMTYGNAAVTAEDIPFLKKLRESSWRAVRAIGAKGMK